MLAPNGVCNLSEVNVAAFTTIVDGQKYLDLDQLGYAVTLASRVGLRMTNVTLELPHWDVVQKRDRLTGVSLTGYVEAMDALGVDTSEPDSQVPTVWGHYRTGVNLSTILQELNEGANFASVQYASEMRIPSPLLVTTV